MRPRRSLAITAVAAAAALLPAAPALAAGGGNSLSAQSCQKGGYANLIRSDGTTFANQDDCVSYAARGGKLQPKPTATLTAVGSYFDGRTDIYQDYITGTGLLPGSTISGVVYLKDGRNSGSVTAPGVVAADGSYSQVFQLAPACGAAINTVYTGTTAAGTPITTTAPAYC